MSLEADILNKYRYTSKPGRHPDRDLFLRGHMPTDDPTERSPVGG